MSLVGAINAESVAATLITRAADTYDAAGNGVLGAETQTPIRAAIQPVSGRDLRDLPEGIRSVVSGVAWSSADMRIDNVVATASERHRVVWVWPRRTDGFTKVALKLTI